MNEFIRVKNVIIIIFCNEKLIFINFCVKNVNILLP